MQIFFKILEYNDRQVLIEKIYDADEEQDAVEVTCHLPIARASLKLNYDSPEGRDEAFDKITQETVGDVMKIGMGKFAELGEK